MAELQLSASTLAKLRELADMDEITLEHLILRMIDRENGVELEDGPEWGDRLCGPFFH